MIDSEGLRSARSLGLIKPGKQGFLYKGKCVVR